MGLKFSIVLLCLGCGLFSYSQQDSIAKNEYITDFNDKISTRISLINTSNGFNINNEGIKYKLVPNKEDYLGFSVLFRSIELDFGFAPKFLNKNKDNKDSQLFTLNIRMFQNQWMQTIDLYKQKGFYTIIYDVRLDLPSTKTFKIGGSTSYIFNPNFSFRAIGFQNEWQTKSAGSFIPRLYYYYTKFEVDDLGNKENYSFYDIAVAPSYYYNFVIHKNFFLALGLSAGIGINHNQLNYEFSSESNTNALYELSARNALGYNSDSFFIGINSNILFLKHHADAANIVDDKITFVEFYIGYRFKAPKKLIKLSDDFNRKFKL